MSIVNETGTARTKSMGVPISPLSAARRMCERSEWALTNLQLQKMLYLAQMFYLGQHGNRLINGSFEAWDYGPVLPTVYGQVKTFGSGPIRNHAFFGVADIIDESRMKVLDEATDQLSQMSAGQLVAITHWKEGAWAKHYVPGIKGTKIPDPDIIDEYRKRTA